MKGLGIERNLGQGITLKRRNGPKGVPIIKRYGTGEEKEMGKPYKPNGAQSQTYYTTQRPRKNGRCLPVKGSGDGQDGNGGDEGRDDKKKFRNTKYDFENKR